jgi:hypothetical protein
MFIRMLDTISTPEGLLKCGDIYDYGDAAAAQSFIRARFAEHSTTPPPDIAEMIDRMEHDDQSVPAIFLPFVGEFGPSYVGYAI